MLNIASLIKGITKSNDKATLSKERIAQLLNTTPEALKAFEDAYRTHVLEAPSDKDVFQTNSREAAEARKEQAASADSDSFRQIMTAKRLADDIIEELAAQTSVYVYDPKSGVSVENAKGFLPEGKAPVSNADIAPLPNNLRPQLTGQLVRKDIDEDSYPMLMFYYGEMMSAKSEKARKSAYHHFRQGLDILDLDPVMYEIIGMNRNSIGHWFPQLVEAHQKTDDGFFKIPATRIAKVPLPILQLTRVEYQSLTNTTMAIVDGWAKRVFDLKPDGDYFIKTGTYSSKFDFRNARVTTPEEVADLGEYLLYIHFQALQMASPLAQPRSIYGVSTTNEWVVREFIENKDEDLTIYKGLPLRTEYRVFIDCDEGTVLSVHPYWDEKVMERRFQEQRDMHDLHDAITFEAHKEKLMERFCLHCDDVREHAEKLAKAIDLSGQWSLDVMQEGDDFYLIDMALAENSAFYDSVPAALRRPSEENWIPRLPEAK